MWATSALHRYMPIPAQASSFIPTRTITWGISPNSFSPGAKRIASAASRDKLLTTAYVNTDGKLAVVVMNRTDEKIEYSLWIKGKAAKTSSRTAFYSNAYRTINNNQLNLSKRGAGFRCSFFILKEYLTMVFVTRRDAIFCVYRRTSSEFVFGTTYSQYQFE
jgi:hypothetical protein